VQLSGLRGQGHKNMASRLRPGLEDWITENNSIKKKEVR